MASTKPDIETVDDTDPRIEYSGSWRQGGVAIEFNSTTHGTTLKDSHARFIFNGMSATLKHRSPQSNTPIQGPLSQFMGPSTISRRHKT